MPKLSGPEPLPQQLFETAAPLHLHACEYRAGEIALPVLTPVSGAKGDRDRNVGAGPRKADDERHQPPKQSAATLHHRDAVRAALAIEIVHGAQRLRQ